MFKEYLFEDFISKEKKSLISGPFGSNISAKFFVDCGVPVIRGNNLSVGFKRFIDDGFVYVTKEKANELNTYAICDDIVFTAVGTLGQVGIIPISSKYPKYIISNKQLRVRLDVKKLDPMFAFYWFTTPWMVELIKTRNVGSTVPLINLGIVRGLPIRLPNDFSYQKKLVKFLFDIDAKIELNNKINAEFEAMAKLIYDYWFVQFEFPNEEGKPYKSSGGKMVWNEELKREVPEGWEVKRLGKYAKIKKGTLITGKTSNSEGKIKVVSAGLDFSYYHDISNYPENTISISASGASSGYINFWREPIFACDCTTVRGANDADTIHILGFLRMRQEFIYQQARGSAQPHVYPKDIEVLLIPTPPTDLIEKFGNKVITGNKKISNNLKENQKLSELRDWLLPMLMNGQVKVN